MIIKHEDVTLRAVEESDMELLREMINNPEIENMVAGSSFPVSSFAQRKWFENLLNNKNELRLIIDTDTYGSIGTITLTKIDWKNRNSQLNIKITNKKDLYGKGYGSKATKALIKYAFEQLNMQCIYSHILEYNIASQRLHEKIGFKKEGILRERVYKNSKYHNLIVWSILKGELNE